MPRAIRKITFTGYERESILAGKKRQTRRVVVPQWPADSEPKEHSQSPGIWIAYDKQGRLLNGHQGNVPESFETVCPFGQPGDRLHVIDRDDPNNRVLMQLHILDVHTEHLRPISSDDAKDEGFEDGPILGPTDDDREFADEAFINAWDAHAQGYWGGRFTSSANPWVWVITFTPVLDRERDLNSDPHA